jgi:hypothetical protein
VVTIANALRSRLGDRSTLEPKFPWIAGAASSREPRHVPQERRSMASTARPLVLRELANRFASSRLTFPNSATSYGRGGGVGRGRGVGGGLGVGVGLGVAVGVAVGVGLPAGNWNLPTRVFQLLPVVA